MNLRHLPLACLVVLMVAAAPVPKGGAEDLYQDARKYYYALKKDPARRKLRHNWLNVARKFQLVAEKYPQSERAPDALFTSAEMMRDLSRISMLDEDLQSA